MLSRRTGLAGQQWAAKASEESADAIVGGGWAAEGPNPLVQGVSPGRLEDVERPQRGGCDAASPLSGGEDGIRAAELEESQAFRCWNEHEP